MMHSLYVPGACIWMSDMVNYRVPTSLYLVLGIKIPAAVVSVTAMRALIGTARLNASCESVNTEAVRHA